MGDRVILQSGPALGLGPNPPSHLSAPLPLDVDLMAQIEVSIVCTEMLVCTWHVPNMVTREYVRFFYCLIMFIEILIRHRFEGNCGFPKKNERNRIIVCRAILLVEQCEIK